jgi:GntR family transcriptional regulator
MPDFHIQPDSDIPASRQLFDQIQFAIASGQYTPGHRLPSTRQLAMMTGLHRNTISKVYRQLEETGLIESIAGSGIYVKVQGHEGNIKTSSGTNKQIPDVDRQVEGFIDGLLSQGFSLSQIKELFLWEVDWRLRCSSSVLVTVPRLDLGAGELMVKELEQALGIPIELVAMEELAGVLETSGSGTVVTSRYFIGQAEAIAAPKSIRIIPVDIYDYSQELEIIKKLPKASCLGVISLSNGIIRVAEILIYSLRGDELLVMTTQASNTRKVNAIVRTAHTIISDRGSYKLVKQAILDARDDLIREPKLLCSENYINEKSINLLKRELGLET